MKLTVLGGSGRIGRHVVEQALVAGHEVSLLVRSRDRLPTDATGLRIVVGTIADEQALAAAIGGSDAVISAIGPQSNNPDEVETLRDGMRRTIGAMRETGVRRIVNLSGAGITAPGDRKPLVDRLMSGVVRLFARHVVAAKQAEYDTLAASDVEWIAVRPALVNDGPLTGDYLAGPNELRPGARVSRADVAHLLLSEAIAPTHVGHPGIFVRST